MPYSEGRVVHDADAHIMETPTWLRDHAEPAFRDRLPVLRYPAATSCARRVTPRSSSVTWRRPSSGCAARHASAEYRADEEAEIMARKNFAATGSFIAADRPRALDLLGFSSQLVFNTFHNGRLHDLEHGDDVELGVRGGPGAQPGHARVLLGRCPAAAVVATCRCATLTWRWRRPGRRWRRARRRCWWRRGARLGTRPATRTSSGCGRRPRRRASPSSSTSAGRAT